MARSIGRYQIREELGRGGMAAVYLAHDPKLEREVALKLLDQQLSTDPTFVARFEREAKTVASLEHNAIVPLHDYGEADGWLYLVMRYMRGGSLKQLLANGPLTTRQAYGVVRRIGSALDKAHSQGVVHRDLKPGNILLDEEHESYLSDFGIVKVATGEAEYLTQTGQALGTFAYMSPEQVMGREVDGRSDIYALGFVLYEMMTGQHPFGDTATTSGAMAVAHAQQPVPDIREANPAAPAALNEVIQKATAKKRDERYASGREMTQAMYEALARKPKAATAARAKPPATVSVDATPAAQEPEIRQPAVAPETRPEEARQPAAAPQAQPRGTPQPAAPVARQPATTSLAHKPPPPPAAQPAREKKGGIPIWILALIGIVGVIGIVVVIGAVIVPPPHPTPTPEPVATKVVEEPPTDEPPTDEPPTDEPKNTTLSTNSLGDTWTRPADDMVMVYVPAGSFLMGSDQGEANERPAHEVSLDAFWIDQTEVTNAQYNRCVADGECAQSEHANDGDFNAADQPVVGVSWFDAGAYCAWAGGQLPSEAQWEYAARGEDGSTYPWGDGFDGQLLNYCDANCEFEWKDDSFDDGYQRTAPVGNYPGGASWAGARDMAGNVSEWVSDWYDRDYYDDSPSQNPAGPVSGEFRVVRGAGWFDERVWMGSFGRVGRDPTKRVNEVGFRCASSIP